MTQTEKESKTILPKMFTKARMTQLKKDEMKNFERDVERRLEGISKGQDFESHYIKPGSDEYTFTFSKPNLTAKEDIRLCNEFVTKLETNQHVKEMRDNGINIQFEKCDRYVRDPRFALDGARELGMRFKMKTSW